MSDKPDILKPVVWDRDSGTMTPVDETDWRVEGTAANRKVERLIKMANRWMLITSIMLAVLFLMTIQLILSIRVGSSEWFMWMTIAQLALTQACYVYSDWLRVELKVCTEDE
jgi:hypothetical protein